MISDEFGNSLPSEDITLEKGLFCFSESTAPICLEVSPGSGMQGDQNLEVEISCSGY